MNAKELADRVVAFGAEECGNDYRWLDAGVIDSVSAEAFINDGRVMLALMEKVSDFVLERSNGGLSLSTKYDTHQPGSFWKRGNSFFDEPFCPAIIEACCEALEKEGD